MPEAAGSETCIIHIGKTGGSALRRLVEMQRARHANSQILMFGHQMTLEALVASQPSARIAFFVREPLGLFVSGFNSRLRCGRPRYNNPWSSQETRFFTAFSGPSDLAEALSSADETIRQTAVDAMNGIMHVRTCLRFYLSSPKALEMFKDRIAFIGSQDHYLDDIGRLRGLIGIDADLELPQDDIGAHRTPSGMQTDLSELAQENLRTWYARDLDIYRWCMARRDVLLHQMEAVTVA